MLLNVRHAWLRQPSLRKLLVALVLLQPLPLLIVVLAGWHLEKVRLVKTAFDQVETTVALVAMLERRRYDGARQVLATLAAAPVVRTSASAPCSAFLADVQRAFPSYTNLGLIDLDGRLLCSAVRPTKDITLPDRAYFKEALRTPEVAAEYVLGRVTNFRALTFALRIEREGFAGPSGVIFAALDLDGAAQRLRELKLPDYLQIDITTETGIVLASTQPGINVLGRPVADAELLQQIQTVRNPVVNAKTSVHFQAVHLIGDFHPTSIVVATQVDSAHLLAPANRLLQIHLAALLLAAALGAVLAWRLGNREIARPIAGLLARMRRFAAGEPDHGPPDQPVAPELASLHAEFTQMHLTIQERGREREQLLSDLKVLQAKVIASQRISRIGYWEIDLRTGRLGGTSHLSGLLGTSIPQSLQEWLMLISVADRERLQASLEKAWADEEPLDIEYQIPLASAAPGWVRMRGEVRRGGDGTPDQLQGSLQDITERKLADLRLTEQMGRLQLLHQITRAIADRLSIAEILRIVVAQLKEQMPLALCAAAPFNAQSNTVVIEYLDVRNLPNTDQMCIAVGDTIPADGDGLSRAVRGELAYEPETSGLQQELPLRLINMGLHSLVLVPMRTQSGVFGVILAARTASESFSSTDCEFLRQLGEQVALALHQAELYTTLQQTYETLEQSQAAALRQERLRALGEMASGIAHDINNALSPLTLYIESLLKHEAGLSLAGREKLAIMQLAAQGVAHTVERMREFQPSNDLTLDKRRAVVNATVVQVIELTGARWRDKALSGGAKIDVVTDLAPDVPDVQIDEGDLRDALINLIFNAVDAMPNGGTLTLRTRRVGTNSRAPLGEICVMDTGVGMTEETRRHCLEPFFSTKGKSGTGLGLAMVHATVQQHHGHLEIETAKGKGTLVRIHLPVHTSVAEDGLAPTARETAPLKLLLVDDDPLVLFPLQDALRDCGHSVTIANGGREALELLRTEMDSGLPFDAVITDLGMPGVDGTQVAREAKIQCPSIFVIMLTGWGRRMAENGAQPPFIDVLLSKPPRIEELLGALDMIRPTGEN